MLHREIEEAHYQAHPRAPRPPTLGRGGIPLWVGEQSSSNTATKKGSKKGTKRKRAPAKAKGKATAQEDDEEDKKKPEKDVYYAFGKTLQLAYRCEDVSKSDSVSFTFRKNSDDGDGILRQLDKLPKRVVAWVFPFDPTKPSEVDPTDGGFPIPERIPIANLFRSGTVDQRNIQK